MIRSVAAAIERFPAALVREAQPFYGDRLLSLAVFGSHATGRARRGSDLDVLGDAAPRRRLRLDEFEGLEARLAPALEAEGWSAELSPVIRTREEAEGFSILYLDMTVHVRIVFDRDRFLEGRLDRLRRELQRLRAERRSVASCWYWTLKKDFRPGNVFEMP